MQKRRPRQACRADAAAGPAACTMLLVDGGFPIDVVFDASVWERRKEKKERGRQGEQAHCGRAHSPAVRQQAARHPESLSTIEDPSDGRPGPTHLSCTQPRCHPPL